MTELTTLRAPMVELTGHMGVVMSADWMTGGEQVITASWDRLAILHDAETGEQISNLTGNPDITDGNQNLFKNQNFVLVLQGNQEYNFCH